MSKIRFTEEQRKAIDITKSSIVVSAAAGSGKTAVLVERICEILCNAQPDVSPDELLVVTFTRAAAKEMSERVEHRLREMLKENPQNYNLKNKLMIPLSNISTIDSFCQKLVKEYFFYCDMQSDFDFADNSQIAEMSKKALDKTIEFMYQQYGDDFWDLSHALFNGAEEAGIRKATDNLYQYIQSLPYPEKYLDLALERYTVSEGKENYYINRQLDFLLEDSALEKYDILAFSANHKDFNLQSLTDMISLLDDIITACRNKNPNACITAFDRLTILQQDKFTEDDEINLANLLSKKCGEEVTAEYVKTEIKKLADYEKSVLVKIGNLQAKHLPDLDDLEKSMEKLYTHTKLLCECVKQYSRNFSQIKKEKNLYTFTDIEHKALALIYDAEKDSPTPLGKEISSRFAFVMADEYQDTNDLQDKILNILSDGGKKLFAVGDGKQAIYRFRLANPEVFFNLKDLSKVPERESVYLSANFRSDAEICESINTVFHTIMSRQLGEVDYNEQEKLVPKAEYAKSDDKKVEYWLIDKSLCSKDDMAIIEAHYIAQWIREKIDSGYEIYDIKLKKYRKLQFSDIAILLRSANSHGGKYKDVLSLYGIPAYFRGSNNPYAGLEVNMVLDLLRVVNNPRYDLPLLSVMLSPFCKMTADDVAKIKLYGKDTLYSSLILASQDGMEKAKQCLDLINSLRKEVFITPLSLFIEKIYLSGGFYASVGAMSDGELRQSNLRKLTALAQKQDEKANGSLIGFIKTVELLAKEKSDSETTAVSGGDVVNIISIHGSKGLEFPVCFIGSLSRGLNTSTDIADFHRNAGIGLYYYDRDVDMRFKNLPRRVVETENRRESMSEELRILYVALTRAKNKLVLLSTEKDMQKKLSSIYEGVSAQLTFSGDKLSPAFIMSKSNYTDILLSAIMLSSDGEKLKMLAGKEDIPKEEFELSKIRFLLKSYSESTKLIDDTDEKAEGVADTVLAEQLKERFEYEYPYVEDINLPSKITASELNRIDHGELYNFTKRPEFLQTETLSAAEKGTALHSFMQYCDFDKASKDAKTEGKRLTESGFITERQLACIDFEKAQKFFESELYSRISHSNEVMREKQFTVLMKANEIKVFENSNRDIIVQGVCDLAFEEDGTLTVIDYKTDKCSNAKELFQKYGEQLRLYATCLEKITSYSVGKIGIYSFSVGEIYEEDFTNSVKMI